MSEISTDGHLRAIKPQTNCWRQLLTTHSQFSLTRSKSDVHTRRRPRLSEIQKRLGVRLLTVDLEKGVCEFEETEFAEEDADPKAHGYLEY